MSSSRPRPPRPRTFTRLGLPLRPLVSAGCLLALAGCSAGAPRVAAPRPTGRAAAVCRALHRALPAEVAGGARRTTRPESEFTAAWGSPAIVLRCGVPRPAVLTPGDRRYDPTAAVADLDGVNWLPTQLSDGGVRGLTTGRQAFVEVTIPKADAGAYGDMSDLTDLAAAIRRTDPETLD